MGRKRRVILVCAAVAIFASLLFPPFHYEVGQGACLQAGYHFILDPPGGRRGATVNTGTLLTIWVGVMLVAGLACLILQQPAPVSGSASDDDPGENR